jgi:LEA14-like dessication related protein
LIENPNPLGMAVRRVRYDLKLNEKQFVQGTLDKGITVPASGSAPLEIPVTVAYLDFFESVKAFIQADEVPYELSGSVTILAFDIPYRTTGKIPVPKLPSISLKQVAIERLSLEGASLVFRLGMENRNDFTLAPVGFRYDIALGGVPFVEGRLEHVKTIQGGGVSVLELPLDVRFVDLGRAAYGLVTQSSSAYSLGGEVALEVPGKGRTWFPFQHEGRVSFQR